EFAGVARATPDFGVRVGPVLTLRYVPRKIRAQDNRLGHEVIVKAILPGDILIADEHCCRGSIIGGNSAAKLQKAGGTALVVNGFARDYAEVHANRLPTLAFNWGLASGKLSIELTSVGDTINFGGVAVSTSDVAIVNQWGMVLVPACLSWEDVIHAANLK